MEIYFLIYQSHISHSSGFVTGTEFAQKRSLVAKITTGCSATDTLLGIGQIE
tara:strand:+ start:554 stop:709 length:156 start_codon:yes stop_codon:yes gene_type:complete